jgi:hypothetical protein
MGLQVVLVQAEMVLVQAEMVLVQAEMVLVQAEMVLVQAAKELAPLPLLQLRALVYFDIFPVEYHQQGLNLLLSYKRPHNQYSDPF